ncbi:MAG: Bcr/CflA family efflux MFS transporter [Alphaproteobacteria bacterium]|nr:Bcr/CflA family efflux MFS transporter [Alphaproteobacteria bacterium]
MTSAIDTARPTGRPSIILLGALAAAGPLALSIHVQSVPAIARELGTSYTSAQLTVSLYLLTFASAQLFIGPLSDKIGRRPVIFGGLVLLAVASIGATFAPSIELLIVARILQALGGCATLVVPRAVVQDIYSGTQAARMMALVAMIQSIAPLTAPIIGGVLDTLLGWRAIFAFLTVFTGVLGVWTVVALTETRPLEADGNSARWGEIFARYGRLLSSRTYVGYTLAFAAGTSGFFGFLAVGPTLIIGQMGFAPIFFSILLMLITIQFPAGNYIATRMTARMGIDRTLLWGAVIGIAAAIGLLALSPVPSLWAIMLPMVVYAFANGILFPNAMAGAASVDRRIAGTAASFAGFSQLGAGAVVAFTISALPTDSFSPYGFSLVILAVATLAGVSLVYSARRRR